MKVLIIKFVSEIIAGKININDDNSLPLMSMAQYLQMEDLRGRVMDYLNKNITRTNVLVIIQKALDYKIGTILIFRTV